MGKTADNGVALLDYRSVPTSIDSDTHDSKTGKKYTVNRPAPGSCVISRALCFLLMAGVVLLLAAAVLATYFLVPGCAHPELAAKGKGQYVMDSEAPEEIREMTDRLPKSLKPVKYRLRIQPFIWEGNFTTNGEVIITLNTTEDTNKVVIHVNDIIIHENSVKVTVTGDESSQIISIVEHKYDTEKQTYTMTLDDYLKTGTLYDVKIRFTGYLNDLLQGMYRISYIDYTNKKIPWMAATQFSPTDARRAFPCLDEPALKARFSISLARWKNMTTRSNMDIQKQEPIEGTDDWVWDHYHETPVMSTYLVAMIVSDLRPFHVSTDSSRTKNINFTVWSRVEALEQTRFAGKIGPQILEYFEKYFGIPYALPKLDMVALPDFGFQAMENWGLITFRESSLLFDEKVSTTESQKHIVTVMSHELGHQWFGNLVTPDWWDDLWLKEGFATYTEYLGAHHIKPEWNMLDEFVTDAIQSSFEVDCLESSHPIYVPVHHSEQIRQIFDPISYKKGASIIRMLNFVLGEHTFKAGLINYLNAKKYANAFHDDLWESLTKQAHIDNTLDKDITLKQIMDSWTLQTGFPVLNVTINYNNSIATITQERFLLTKNASMPQTWWVPISYTTSKLYNFDTTTKPKVWMKNEPEIAIQLNLTQNDFLYINVKHGGYYRVNYDYTNWLQLTRSMLNFPHVVQAQLIDDAMNLARANLLDYEVPLSLAIESFRNTKHISMSTALRNMKYIDNMLASTPAYGKFKLFMSQLIRGVYDSLGFSERPEDNYDTKMKRTEILKWACTFENSDCTINARQMFRDWMVDEADKKNTPAKRTVPPNLRPTVYCTAIREGGEAEWDFAFTKYQNTNSGAEKELLLNSLGCASEGWLLSRYLSYALSNSSGIRKQDGVVIFRSVTQNVAGHQLAFNFLRGNWKALNNHYGLAFSTISKMVSALPVFMNTPYELEHLEAFKKENINNLGTAERAFDQSIEATRINVEWVAHSYKRIEQWLDETLRKYRLHSYNFT